MGRDVNQGELSAIIGISDVTIREWQSAKPTPLPIKKRGAIGEEHLYDTAEVIAWMIARAEEKVRGGESPRDRESRLRSELMELDLLEKRKVLVPIDQVEPVWQSRVFAAAAFLQGEPSRLAAILEGTVGIEAKRELLRREFVEFLQKLGANGEQMQIEVQQVLERLSADDAAALISRLSKGHEPVPDAPRSSPPGVEGPHPGTEDPAVGVG